MSGENRRINETVPNKLNVERSGESRETQRTESMNWMPLQKRGVSSVTVGCNTCTESMQVRSGECS